MDCDELYEKFGPFKEITREQETKLLNAGKWRNVLCVMSGDNDTLYAAVGHHLVNVDVILESKKKMPPNLTVDDFWFTE